LAFFILVHLDFTSVINFVSFFESSFIANDITEKIKSVILPTIINN
jgi:hypothetical protein